MTRIYALVFLAPRGLSCGGFFFSFFLSLLTIPKGALLEMIRTEPNWEPRTGEQAEKGITGWHESVWAGRRHGSLEEAEAHERNKNWGHFPHESESMWVRGPHMKGTPALMTRCPVLHIR
jgi:hypothetical protein